MHIEAVDTVIRNGTVVLKDEVIVADIAIRNGKIVGITIV